MTWHPLQRALGSGALLLLLGADAGARPEQAPVTVPSVVALEASFSVAELLEYVRRELGSTVELRLPFHVREARQARRASGIALDANGGIVTSASFVLPGGMFCALLVDGRSVPAELVGVDPASDLAVLRLHNTTTTPARFALDGGPAEGEMLRIVGSGPAARCNSGQGRLVRASLHPGAGRLHDFLHLESTSGSTGAAVLDAEGHVVGMVTALRSGGGTLAVPARTVVRVSREILKHGRVRRGWLGLTGISGEALSRPARGVRVQGTVVGGPAAAAGIAPGDIVLRYDGKEVDDTADLVRLVSDTTPGRRVPIACLRNGREWTTAVTLVERPRGDHRPGVVVRLADERPYLGLEIQQLTPGLRERMGLGGDAGVLVSRVAENSPAERAGIVQGDVVTRAAGHVVRTPAEVVEAVQARAAGDEVEIEILRQLRPSVVQARLERRPVRTYLSELPRFHLALDPQVWAALTRSIHHLPLAERMQGLQELRRVVEGSAEVLQPEERRRLEQQIERLAQEFQRHP